MPVNPGFKICRKCKETKDLIHFPIRSDSLDGFRNECHVCNRAKVTKWRLENPERAKQSKKQCYETKKEYYKDKMRQDRQNNPLKYKLRDAQKHSNKLKKNKTKPKWAINFNPKKSLAWVNLYRLKDGQMFCKQFIEETKIVYEKCPKNFHVDHIIPINNEFVSGLHVPWNLQYLTFEENLLKRNQFDGSYNNESWKLLCPSV